MAYEVNKICYWITSALNIAWETLIQSICKRCCVFIINEDIHKGFLVQMTYTLKPRSVEDNMYPFLYSSGIFGTRLIFSLSRLFILVCVMIYIYRDALNFIARSFHKPFLIKFNPPVNKTSSISLSGLPCNMMLFHYPHFNRQTHAWAKPRRFYCQIPCHSIVKIMLYPNMKM